ncbi:MAG: hypothetical protein R3E96_10025 [Planctomycetota bacterium]
MCIPDGATISLDVLFTLRPGRRGRFPVGFHRPELWRRYQQHLPGPGLQRQRQRAAVWTNTTGAAVNAVLEVNVYAFSASDCSTYDLAITGSGNCGGPSFPTFALAR